MFWKMKATKSSKIIKKHRLYRKKINVIFTMIIIVICCFAIIVIGTKKQPLSAEELYGKRWKKKIHYIFR